MQSTSESSTIIRIQKFLCWMKLEFRIILKMLINFSNFEPEYSYKLFSYKKNVYIKTCKSQN